MTSPFNFVIPFWVKPVAILLVLGSVWGHGAYKGHEWAGTDFKLYKAEEDRIQSEATQKSLNKFIRQQGINLKSETNLNRRLNAANKRLRQYTRDESRRVPAVPESPRQPDARPTNEVSSREVEVLREDYNRLYLDCTLTTIIADEWQQRERELIKEE
jgi:hypothetical protein